MRKAPQAPIAWGALSLRATELRSGSVVSGFSCGRCDCLLYCIAAIGQSVLGSVVLDPGLLLLSRAGAGRRKLRCP